ncbi:MAG: reverse transcriptase family protein, partial [Clostridium sp.]
MREPLKGASTHAPCLGPLCLTDPLRAKQVESTYNNLKFATTIEGVQLAQAPTVTVHVFTNPDIQDVLEWAKSIRQLVQTNNWNDETAKSVLLALVSDQFHEVIAEKRTFDTKLDALVKFVYKPESFTIFRTMLRQAKTRDFKSIEEFFLHLEKTKERADLCLAQCSNNDKIPERDIVEIILHQLTIKEKEMLLNVQAQELKEIKRALIKFKALQSFYDISEPIRQDSASYRPLHFAPKDRTYCSYHKSNMHNTSDCIAYANWKRKNTASTTSYSDHKPNVLAVKSNSESFNHTPASKNNSFSLNLILNDSAHANFIVDSGSDNNFISPELVTKIKDPIEENVYGMEISLANGTTVKIKSKLRALVSIPDVQTSKVLEDFYILPNLPHDGLLGCSFLRKHGCVINFMEEDILFRKSTKNPTDPDTELLNKTIPFCSTTMSFEDLVLYYKRNNPTLGRIGGQKMHIHLNDQTPVHNKPYNIPLNYQKQVKDEVKKLLKLGIIRESHSPYSAPAFARTKKNGNIRLLIDYRGLNKKTIKQGYPFPSIQNSLTDLQGATVFSQLDLNMGYYQIEIAPESIPKTAFVLPFGQYEFLRMPFGLANAPREFQRIMNSKLSGFD